jgi:nitrate reductase NapE component
MLIWSGFGFLVPVTAFACLLASELGVETYFGDDGYYQAHGWPKMAAFLVAAAVIWPIGAALDRRGGRTLVDPETGERFRVGGIDTFFFIPIKWWPLLCVGLGAAFSFVGNE